jgi:hypothetical protein
MLRVPVMSGMIERRMLVNYRVDPDVVAAMLPAPFEPQVVNGFAVAGICLIRLGDLRPKALPGRGGLTSENAAHRFAVRWEDAGGPRTGVYISRRDSSSTTTVLAGDRLFPGYHRRADFTVIETDATISVSFVARDQSVAVDIDASIADALPQSVLFGSIDDASEFFRAAPAGFSPTRRTGKLDGLELRTNGWAVEPAVIHSIGSSLFDDRSRFPVGSIELDSALVMRKVPVEWHGIGAVARDRVRGPGSELLAAAAGAA